MYKIYTTRPDSKVPRDLKRLVPYEFETMEHAARGCVDLFTKGYIIHKVVLPSGREVSREGIERALIAGVSSVRARLRK